MRRALLTSAAAMAGVALLAAAPASASIVTATATVPDDSVGTAIATCPAGRRATGGGFQLSRPEIFRGVYESQKIGQRSWQASASRAFTGSTGSATLLAYANCERGAPKTGTKSSGPSSAVADATCGRGKRIQAGGFATDLVNVPNDSFRVGKRTWRVTQEEEIATTFSFAYCADAPAPRIRETSLTGPPNMAFPVVSPTCPGKTTPVAGGFFQPDKGPVFDRITPYESVPTGDAWLTSGRTISSLDRARLNSIVYCG